MSSIATRKKNNRYQAAKTRGPRWRLSLIPSLPPVIAWFTPARVSECHLALHSSTISDQMGKTQRSTEAMLFNIPLIVHEYFFAPT